MPKKAKKKATPKIGRPSKYSAELCDMLIKHMSKGLSFEAFGAIADVTYETLHQWKKKYPAFSDAKKRGLEYSRYFWEMAGIEGMFLGKAFVPAVWIFNMRNRFGWRDDPIGDNEPKVFVFSNKKAG